MNHEAKKFNISYQASFKSNSDNETMIWLVEPADLANQKINKFAFNHKQDSEYSSNGNLIHSLKLAGKKIELKVKIQATLSQKNISNEGLIITTLSREISEQYLKSEKYLEQTREIINLTQRTISGIKTYREKVEEIFKYVVRNFKYCYPVTKRGVKNLDLDNLTGDCAEYSSLFVTMCRIAGVAARNVTGYVIFEDEKQISEHGWAQVYVNGSWLDADTQYASLENSIESGLRKYLFNRSDFRLIVSVGFNTKLRPQIPESFDLTTAEKLGLIISSNVAQVFQPLVFASKKHFVFEDEIALD